jgi:ribonuclease HI
MRSSLFLADLWWTWRHRSLICLSQETWSLPRLNYHIQNTVDVIEATFHSAPVLHTDRMVRWNDNYCNCVALNVDDSCLGSPIRVGYGSIIWNSAGFFLTGFSGFIATTSDILFAEHTAIQRGMLLAIENGFEEMVCYSDSLLSIKLVTECASHYHAYAVLIQDIKDLISSRNFTIHHCLREGNQCADFMAKLGATSNE